MPTIMPNVGRSRPSCRASLSMIASTRCAEASITCPLPGHSGVLRAAETGRRHEHVLETRRHARCKCTDVRRRESLRNACLGFRGLALYEDVQTGAQLRDAEHRVVF